MDEKLAYTFRLYGKCPGLLVGMTAIVALLPQLPSLFLPPPDLEDPFANWQAGVAMNLFSLLLTPLYTGAFLWVVDAVTRNETPTLGRALAAALPRYLRLALVFIATGLLTLLGLFFCLIPGIYVGIKLSFANVLVMCGNATSADDALRRSWKLTEGYGWQIFGAGILFSIPLIVVSLVIGFLGMTWPQNYLWIQIVLTTFAAICLSPIHVFLYICFREASFEPDYAADDADNSRLERAEMP